MLMCTVLRKEILAQYLLCKYLTPDTLCNKSYKQVTQPTSKAVQYVAVNNVL